MALAEKKIAAKNNTSIKPLVAGRYDHFLATYPRKK
jgi:hypothetical protein